MSKFVSIIIAHFAPNKVRSKVMRISLESLFESLDYPAEIIVIDNGGSESDSKFLFDLAKEGKIHTYIRNAKNMHFPFARNQGLQIANGDYIASCDNDIFYDKGWLSKCVEALEANPKKKLYATPIYNVTHWRPKYWAGTVKVGKKTYRLNYRAGSNCFVIRREDMEKIGRFWRHRVAGTKWTNKATRLGYKAVVIEPLMVRDLGFRKGYNLKEALDMKMVLSDGSEIYFNNDEHRYLHSDKKYTYREQGFFAQGKTVKEGFYDT